MKIRNVFFIILALSFIIPQVTLASWWNPFTWHIFSSRNVTPSSVSSTSPQITQTATTSNQTAVSTSTPKISNLKKNRTIPIKINSQSQTSGSNVVPVTNTKNTPTDNYNPTDFVTILNQTLDLYSSLRTKIVSEISQAQYSLTDSSLNIAGYRAQFNQVTQDLINTDNDILKRINASISELNTYESNAYTNAGNDRYNQASNIITTYLASLKDLKYQNNDAVITYNSVITQIAQSVSRNNTVNQYQQPATPDFYSQWQQCLVQLNQIDAQIRTDISKAGGMATESQVRAQVRQQALQQGLPCANSY